MIAKRVQRYCDAILDVSRVNDASQEQPGTDLQPRIKRPGNKIPLLSPSCSFSVPSLRNKNQNDPSRTENERLKRKGKEIRHVQKRGEGPARPPGEGEGASCRLLLCLKGFGELARPRKEKQLS